MTHKSISERFWEKVLVAGADDCWLWRGCCGPRGYGRFSINGKNAKAHRTALMLRGVVEPFDGAAALHACDNPSCVNPSHLRWGTQTDNMRDRSHRGRVGLSSLSADDVRTIRASSKTQRSLAAEFGVTPSAIYKIVAGKSWRHVS